MELDKVLVALGSIAGIVITYWFFLMRKDEEAYVVSGDSVEITVKGGYVPSVISLPKNKVTTFNFIRTDPSMCLEEVVLPDFKIKKYLPLHKTVPIKVHPKNSGTYDITCGMNMFHGKIKVT